MPTTRFEQWSYQMPNAMFCAIVIKSSVVIRSLKYVSRLV